MARLPLAQGHQLSRWEAVQPYQWACLSRQESGQWQRLTQRPKEEVEGTSLQGIVGSLAGNLLTPSCEHPSPTRDMACLWAMCPLCPSHHSPQSGPLGGCSSHRQDHEAGWGEPGVDPEPVCQSDGGHQLEAKSGTPYPVLLQTSLTDPPPLEASPGALQRRKLMRDLILLYTPSILCR